MNELKTLKDIVPYDKMSNDGNNQDMIDKKELRKETINWIKSISIMNFDMFAEESNSAPTFKEKRIVSEAVVSWIKHFFNIAEEELK